MSKFFATTAAIALIVGSADAAQLTLGANDVGQYDWTGAPPGSVLISSPAIIGQAGAFFGGDAGDYTFGPLAATQAGPQSGGNFPTTAPQAFAYAAPDGDALSGVVQWSLAKDDSPNPDLIGALNISARSGDAAFVSAFAGSSAEIDLVLVGKYPNTPFLDDLAANGGQGWYLVSAGEVTPAPAAPVSEPSALTLLGAALLGLWMYARGHVRVR